MARTPIHDDSDKPCKTPNCKNHALWKGLCRSCYGQAKDLIDKELTSWDELGTMGLIEVPNKLFKNEFFRRKAMEEQRVQDEEAGLGQEDPHSPFPSMFS